MKIDLTLDSAVERTPRVMQLEGLFDVPAAEKLTRQWHGDLPLEERPWHVGLIVGPSGCGKTVLTRQLFGVPAPLRWQKGAVIDDFPAKLSMQDIVDACSSIGFNTVPSWMKPFAVLSNGERFRVEIARRLLSDDDPIVVDEFTSVVDRQVACIASHAIAKYVRRKNRKFIGVTCHYDVIDWLQPDWLFEPATMTLQWRLLQRRPDIDVEICRVDSSAWALFAPFHYMSGHIHVGARCFVLYVDGRPASFAGVLHRPRSKAFEHTSPIWAISRAVTLPDFQGIGLMFVLINALGANYAALNRRLRNYPAHPAFIKAHDRSPLWMLIKKPGFLKPNFERSTIPGASHFGGRPCATFEYVGPIATNRAAALAFVEGREVRENQG